MSNLEDTVALNEARVGPFLSSTTGTAGLTSASPAANRACPPSHNYARGEGQSPAVVYALPLNWCEWQPIEARLASDRDYPGSSGSDIDGYVSAGTATPAKNVWHPPTIPRTLDGECFNLILGSELVYAPHHRCLADLVLALLRAHRDQQPQPQPDAPQACCVIVQRGDRPGWAHFLARARTLGLAALQARNVP